MNDYSRTSYEPASPDTPDSMTPAQDFAHEEDPATGEGGLAVLLCAVLVIGGLMALEWCAYAQSQGGAPW